MRAQNGAFTHAGSGARSPLARAPALPDGRRVRHNHATNVRREFGLEAAQILLGDAKADVTQIYAERDLTHAATVAAKID